MKLLLTAIKFWVWNILLALDQLGNAILLGDPKETISRRAGQAAEQGKDWGCLLCHFLDEIDPRHCQSALQVITTGDGSNSVAALLTAWKKAQAGSGPSVVMAG